MLVGILSDTHSDVPAITDARRQLALARVDMMLHCGDIDTPTVVPYFPVATQFVLGNCDRPKAAFRAAIADHGATLYEGYGQLSIDGITLAWTHGDDELLMQDLLAAEAFDFLFHGHTHVAGQRQIGPTCVVNPGALHRGNPRSFAILDTQTRHLKSMILQ